jgi:hypothetical protein
VQRSAFHRLIVNAVRHVYPAELGPPARGLPTAHAGVRLSARLSAVQVYVWPLEEADTHGTVLVPLHSAVPKVAREDHAFHELMALIDVFRVGRARECRLADERLAERILDQVADELGWVTPAPVFLGGATIGLYLDEFGRSQLRPTQDIDCIVPQILSRAAWWNLEEQLRDRGWMPVQGGPICRYRSPSGALVDLMAETPEVLGFGGRWYQSTVRDAQPRELVTGRRILVPTPEHLLACKLEAWQDRGQEDSLLSQDLEDIVSLLDGCRELEASVRAASRNLQEWLAEHLGELLDHRGHREALLAHVPRGGDQSAREERLLGLMSRLAQTAK